MLEISKSVRIPESEIEVHDIRGKGPGGRKADSAANAVELRFDIRHSSLPVAIREGLLAMQDHRISKDGEVVIQAKDHRSHERNLEEARARLKELVRKAGAVPNKRRPTRPSRAARRKRQEAKKRHKQKKALRKKVL
ncbi:alternative ribosome rescue aminoacyl-tRNA hydrolase ArfB [Thiohalorhabdus sp.]|uniref:alternative ribosome rescue aminoacyl-tRNA hydrolase ArfB n=1 Tax=Thiohalorhabdus sp. TaxID=3094134 RepID=UPI002FC39C9B